MSKLKKGEIVTGTSCVTGSFYIGVYSGGDKDRVFLKPAYGGKSYPEYFPVWVYRESAVALQDVLSGVSRYIAGRKCDNCVSRHAGYIPCSGGIADAEKCPCYKRVWWKFWEVK